MKVVIQKATIRPTHRGIGDALRQAIQEDRTADEALKSLISRLDGVAGVNGSKGEAA